MKSLRPLLALLLALLALAVLPATGAPAPGPEEPLIEGEPFQPSQVPVPGVPQPPARAALTFWCSPHPREAGWAVQVTRAWNALHPDQTVRLQALPQDRLAEDVIREAIQSKTTPDLTNHLFPVNAHEFAAMGGLLPLDGQPALLQHLAQRCGPGADTPFRSPDGKLYQFPWKNNPVLLQFNDALFRRYGLSPARTYSEFLATGQRLASSPTGHKIWLWAPSPANKFWRRYYDFFPLFLAASGGQGLLTPEGRANFDNEAGVGVMEFLARLYRSQAAPTRPVLDDPEQQVRAFVKADLAMMMTGPWGIDDVLDAGSDEVSFDFTGLPVPDDYPADRPVWSYGNFRGWGIFSTCENPALAAEFIRFATGREHDLALMQTALQLPYRQGLLEDPEFVTALQQVPAPLAKFALQSRWCRPVDNQPYFNEVLKILSDEMVACAVEGKKTPQEAVREAARRTNLLAEQRARASAAP